MLGRDRHHPDPDKLPEAEGSRIPLATTLAALHRRWRPSVTPILRRSVPQADTRARVYAQTAR
jgi:hypothetical protein